jgi:hypothetical protein
METVQFENGMNLSDALDSAGRINTSRELARIIFELDEACFESPSSLMKSIKKYTDELDPFDPYTTIKYIIENIKDGHKRLLDPVNMIMNIDIKQKRSLSRCFSRA